MTAKTQREKTETRLQQQHACIYNSFSVITGGRRPGFMANKGTERKESHPAGTHNTKRGTGTGGNCHTYAYAGSQQDGQQRNPWSVTVGSKQPKEAAEGTLRNWRTEEHKTHSTHSAMTGSKCKVNERWARDRFSISFMASIVLGPVRWSRIGSRSSKSSDSSCNCQLVPQIVRKLN